MNLVKLADSLKSDLELIESIKEVIREHQPEVTEKDIIEFWDGNGNWGRSHYEAAVIKACEKSGENEVCWGCNTYKVNEDFSVDGF